MKLVFATHNSNKLKEIQQLVPEFIELVSLDTIGCTEEIPETAKTLEGNAKIKADYVTKNHKLPCFADDTGLLVNSLNGEPGIYSARYAGPQNDSQANMTKLLSNLIGKNDRSAHFKTVIALNLNGETHIFEGIIDGEIIEDKKGKNGFGYDPIFVPNGYNETFAQLPLSVKNDISHRGQAFKKLIAYLNNINVTGQK
ncbi:non-canonical purine NTP diphosphatase [uncultured Maribacter sp.]|uniref:non-canonical purine NTP diphosphatase n=1 Tax=uncultured Maribacter sp. TaxID=431308 RepID=UPI0030EC9799|tara:strand:- start:13089 stop:13682 length:594 start_codon:yes stop_codon:yes gene_type:complete